MAQSPAPKPATQAVQAKAATAPAAKEAHHDMKAAKHDAKDAKQETKEARHMQHVVAKPAPKSKAAGEAKPAGMEKK